MVRGKSIYTNESKTIAVGGICLRGGVEGSGVGEAENDVMLSDALLRCMWPAQKSRVRSKRPLVITFTSQTRQ